MNISEAEARVIIELVHMAEFPVDGADDLYSRIQREFPAIGEEHRLHREFSDLNVQTLRDAREVPRVAEAFMRLSSAKEATMSKGKHVTEAEKAEEEAANRAYQDALNEERTKLIKERGLESFGQWSMRQTWSLNPREDEMQEATEWEVVKRVEAIIKGMDFPEGMRIDVGRARYEGGEVEGIGFRVVIDGKPGRSRVYAADDIQDMSDRDIRELVAGLLREESLARLIKTFRSHERVNWILMGVFVFWVVFWVVLLASRLP